MVGSETTRSLPRSSRGSLRSAAFSQQCTSSDFRGGLSRRWVCAGILAVLASQRCPRGDLAGPYSLGSIAAADFRRGLLVAVLYCAAKSPVRSRQCSRGDLKGSGVWRGYLAVVSWQMSPAIDTSGLHCRGLSSQMVWGAGRLVFGLHSMVSAPHRQASMLLACG